MTKRSVKYFKKPKLTSYQKSYIIQIRKMLKKSKGEVIAISGLGKDPSKALQYHPSTTLHYQVVGRAFRLPNQLPICQLDTRTSSEL